MIYTSMHRNAFEYIIQTGSMVKGLFFFGNIYFNGVKTEIIGITNITRVVNPKGSFMSAIFQCDFLMLIGWWWAHGWKGTESMKSNKSTEH